MRNESCLIIRYHQVASGIAEAIITHSQYLTVSKAKTERNNYNRLFLGFLAEQNREI